jgi:hypothetical protein
VIADVAPSATSALSPETPSIWINTALADEVTTNTNNKANNLFIIFSFLLKQIQSKLANSKVVDRICL